jgi:putative copper export protein
MINAFPPVALASAGIAAVTGVFAGWLHVGTIPNLWGTRYGIIPLIKLAILGIVADVHGCRHVVASVREQRRRAG